MKRLKILLTNDDGIHALGLKCLWESVKSLGDIFIAAPSKQQSGRAAGVTFKGPLHVQRVSSYEKTAAWKVKGSPADCVRIALGELLSSPPDLILSGINHGSNAGRTIIYSGTVGAVIEGTLRGIPGIAFSYACPKTSLFPQVKTVIPKIIQHLQKYPLEKGSFLNINFPHTIDKLFKGYKMTSQGKGYWVETSRKKVCDLEKGITQYWTGASYISEVEHDLSDVALLEKGYVTATPICISELTDHAHLKAAKNHFEKSFLLNP